MSNKKRPDAFDLSATQTLVINKAAGTATVTLRIHGAGERETTKRIAPEKALAWANKVRMPGVKTPKAKFQRCDEGEEPHLFVADRVVELHHL